MKTRLIAILISLSILHAAPQVRAQCANWEAGPLDNGTAPNGVNGSVRAMTLWEPPGSSSYWLVIAGQFTSVQGVPASNLAMRDPGTGLWQALGSGTDGDVSALAVFNGDLVAAGSFANAGGQAVDNIAQWDGSSWQPLQTGGNSGTNGPINAMTVYNGALVVGGSFTQSGGNHYFANTANIAQWDGSVWSGLGVGVGCFNNSCNGYVTCLAQYNGNLIAGGTFGAAGNSAAAYIAQWNGSSWSPLGGDRNGAIYALQPFNGELVVGGMFTSIDHEGGVYTSANYIAAWNGSSWRQFGGGTNYPVGTLGYFNGELVAAGEFTQAGGVAANQIAIWTGSTWQAMGTGFGGGSNFVAAVMQDGSDMVTGGGFTQAGTCPANNLARWDGTQWGSYGGGTAGLVFAMTNYGGRLVAGGDFHQSTAGLEAHDIAGWDGNSLATFGTGMDGSVVALLAFKYPGIRGANELVAGGLFPHAGGTAVNYVARWDQSFLIFTPPAWQAMGAGFNSGVYALERFNSATYAGGPFTYSSSAVSYIARFNDTSGLWEAVGTGMNGTVRALRAYNGYLYAGGDFTFAGGVHTGGLARWDGTSWTQCGGTFTGSVYSLAVYNGMLVIGGSYPGINSSPNLAEYDGTYYYTFGTGGTNGTVHALYVNGTQLFIGGDFSTAGGIAANHVAYWDGASWHQPSAGADNTVLALSGMHNEVDAGGLFQNVQGGTLASPRWARYSGTGAPWISVQPGSQNPAYRGSASFTAQAAPGYSGMSYRWLFNGTPLSDGTTFWGSVIAGSTTPTLSLSNVTNSDAGSYTMALSNTCGSDTSGVGTLTLNGTASAPDPGAAAATVFDAIGPNPTPGGTRLLFTLARDATVRVSVHDVAGRLVRSLDLGPLGAGSHAAAWDTRGDDGRRVAAGLYFVGLEVDGRRLGARRLVVAH